MDDGRGPVRREQTPALPCEEHPRCPPGLRMAIAFAPRPRYRVRRKGVPSFAPSRSKAVTPRYCVPFRKGQSSGCLRLSYSCSACAGPLSPCAARSSQAQTAAALLLLVSMKKGPDVIHEGAGRVKGRSRATDGGASRVGRRPGGERRRSSHPFGRAGRARVSCGARGLNQSGGRRSPISARRGH
jgi:hypothetical protein